MTIDTATLARCLGNTRSVQGGWIASCPVPGHGRGRGDRTPSLSIIDVEGKTLFYCHAGCPYDEIIGTLRNRGILLSTSRYFLPISGQSKKLKLPNGSTNAAVALSLWRKAQNATGTLVESYLAQRGITGPIPPTIRYLANQKHVDGNYYPVMVSAVTIYPDIKVSGIHRTYLDHSGSGKAAIGPNKKMLGSVNGGAVHLGPAGKSLAVTEGIETALSVNQSTELSVWAALSTGGLRNLALPDPSIVETVIICADNDDAGITAANIAAQRWIKKGHIVKIATPPPGQDFNDLLIGKPNLNGGGK
jgi:putative DNA primase/helicase